MTTETDKALDALAGMTQQTDAENPSAEAQAEQAHQQAQQSEADAAAKQWGMLMYTVGGFAQMIAPELKQVYSEERCFQWGQQANSVAEKYGWNGPSAMPELALIASTAGFAVPTYFLIRAKVQEAQKGNGPQSWIAKMGIWWRTRKARAAATAQPAPAPEARPDGSE
jgi:hypothetical protein